MYLSSSHAEREIRLVSESHSHVSPVGNGPCLAAGRLTSPTAFPAGSKWNDKLVMMGTSLGFVGPVWLLLGEGELSQPHETRGTV